MILLDTNVIAELMRPAITPAVAAYLQAQDPQLLFTASLCAAEIHHGIARLPTGPRREALARAFHHFLAEGLTGRVLVFDNACAEGYARVRVRREAAGLPISLPDAMIAGTALAHGATVASRNVGDFAGCGVAIANPWDGP